MALSIQKLMHTPCHKLVVDVQSFVFEVLPYHLSPEDAYEDDAFVYSGSGTMCHQVLYPRKSTARLVVSRPRKPQKKATPSLRKKIHWPDAHDIKGLTSFCQKHLGGLSSPAQRFSNDNITTPAKSANADSDITMHATPGRSRVASILTSGKIAGRPVSRTRFGRGTQES